MLTDPIKKFIKWRDEAVAEDFLKYSAAVHVATISPEGFPEGRNVDLKSVDNRGFIFCTHLDSAKSKSLIQNDTIALTFWWDHMGRQVRVSGRSELISSEEADSFFAARPRDAQLVSWASCQSAVLEDPEMLRSTLSAYQAQFIDRDIPRPDYWGGYLVRPRKFEFLEFRQDRLHQRMVYRKDVDSWALSYLQP